MMYIKQEVLQSNPILEACVGQLGGARIEAYLLTITSYVRVAS